MPSDIMQASAETTVYIANGIVSTGQGVFTVRVEDEILKKFCYVAEYNARSANKEVEFLMKRHIVKFEKAYGKITFD